MAEYDPENVLHQCLRRLVERSMRSIGQTQSSIAHAVSNPEKHDPFKYAEDIGTFFVRTIFSDVTFRYEDLKPNQEAVDLFSTDGSVLVQVKLGTRSTKPATLADLKRFFVDALSVAHELGLPSSHQKRTFIYFARKYSSKVSPSSLAFLRKDGTDMLLYTIIAVNGFVTIVPSDDHTAEVTKRRFDASPDGIMERERVMQYFGGGVATAASVGHTAAESVQTRPRTAESPPRSRKRTFELIAYENCARLAGEDLRGVFPSSDVLPHKDFPQNHGSTAKSLRDKGHTEYATADKKYTRLTEAGRQHVVTLFRH